MTNDDLSYADAKLAEAASAISDMVGVMELLQKAGLDGSGFQERLSILHTELRQWREYRALVLIRKGMLAPGESGSRRSSARPYAI